MFGPAGNAYVYLIYGMHLCFNVVSGEIGEGEAVLIRALEPWNGIPSMRQRRQGNSRKEIAETKLCAGPARLVSALGITLEHNATNLRTGPIRIHQRNSFPKKDKRAKTSNVVRSGRVGISKGQELLLRYYFEDSAFLSRPAHIRSGK
jgi:DNA-3-methyladenine glycosylase